MRPSLLDVADSVQNGDESESLQATEYIGNLSDRWLDNSCEMLELAGLLGGNARTAHDALYHVDRRDERMQRESTCRVRRQKPRDLDLEGRDIGNEQQS